MTFTILQSGMAVANSLARKESQERMDLVAYWSVPLSDGVHTVEFEHGTVSGKRVLRIDGKEIIRRDWMFKLVGDERFTIGKQKTKCELKVEPLPHFAYSYILYVAGKPLNKFTEEQGRILKLWVVIVSGKRYRIVLEKNTLDVWVNGSRMETENVFVEHGTEMRFPLGDEQVVIRSNSGDRKIGLIYRLFVAGSVVMEEPN